MHDLALGTVSGAHFNPAVTVAIMAADLAVTQIDVDQAALAGEPLAVTWYEGDETLMGSTVVRGETEGTRLPPSWQAPRNCPMCSIC